LIVFGYCDGRIRESNDVDIALDIPSDLLVSSSGDPLPYIAEEFF